MVASLLGGKEQNTAFVAFAPDGKTRLTKTGRSPRMVWGNRGTLAGLQEIADRYKTKTDLQNAVLQDFHSLNQALKTGAADQRLVVFLAQPTGKASGAQSVLREVFNNKDVRGRMHFDVLSEDDRETWKKIEGGAKGSGFYVVRPGAFGKEGKVIVKMPLASSAQKLEAAILKANREFATSEERKNHREHVAAGNEAGMSRRGRRTKRK